MSEACVERVWQNFGNGHGQSAPCGRKGKVCAGDKWYCGIHDPAAVEKRKQKSEAKYAADMAKWRADHDRKVFDGQVGDICRERGLTPETLRAALDGGSSRPT